nr:MAG TPA: hypothetical protein [Caudoviricetes sp.]
MYKAGTGCDRTRQFRVILRVIPCDTYRVNICQIWHISAIFNN